MINQEFDDAHGDGGQPRVVEEKNFPPLPSFCCVGPCFYHNIEAEIPAENQKTCRIMFLLLKLYVFCLFVNCIACFSSLCIGAPGGVSMFVVSLIYLIFFPALAFLAWYRPIYIASRDGSSLYYILFFVLFAIELLFKLLWAIGGMFSGAVGWMNAIYMTRINLPGKTVVAVIFFISAIAWTILTALEIWVLIKIIAAYRVSGASVEKARAELESRGTRQV